MSKGRYADSKIIDGKFYETFKIPVSSNGMNNFDFLAGVKTREYVIQVGDRLDHIAARMLGDDKYWWVLALVNDMTYPFAEPGTTIKVPYDLNDVLSKIMR